MPSVLWWGSFDPDYSRNRVLRKLLAELGWRVLDFHPRFSALADWEARARHLATPDLVWVPCFRQRDLAAAGRWAHARRVPLLFDPLISAYDKQVFEREKFAESSAKAARLLRQEQALFRRADILLADTAEHARFFTGTLAMDPRRVHVVFVGAEEALFHPGEYAEKSPEKPLEALFYGSFIPLQGAGVIVEAARRYTGPPVRWTLVGAGPELAACKQAAAGLPDIAFEPWIDYAVLPERIRRADILLGVFGATAKAGRVIPNKVFQSLACGKPVVTRRSPAYPADVADRAGNGLIWVEGGDARGLAEAVAGLSGQPGMLGRIGWEARATFERHFSEAAIRESLAEALAALPEPVR